MSLRFYGNADRAERWVADEAEMWNNRAVEVWGVNYPGFGGSTGPARLAHGAGCVDRVRRSEGSGGHRPIIAFGASLGTTVALDIAAHRPVAGIILQNPPPLRQMFCANSAGGTFGCWPVRSRKKFPCHLDSIANAKATRAPAIFLLADEDEVVAPRFQALVVDAYAGEKRVIQLTGADHNSPIDDGLTKLHDALDWLLARP